MISFKNITKQLLGLGVIALLSFQSCKKNYSPDEPFPQEFTPTIYTGSNNEVLYAIDVATGKHKWKTNLDGVIGAAPLFSFNHLYVGTEAGTIYRIDYHTGDIKSEVNLSGPIIGSPITYGDHVIVASGNKVYALNPNDLPDSENRLFTYTAPGTIVGSPTIHEVDGLTEGPYIFIATMNDKVVAINNQGNAAWEYTAAGGSGFESSPNVTNDSFLYVGNNNGKLYNLYTHNGSLKWAYETAGAIKSSPILVDGNVMFGSYDRNLYSVDSATGLIRWTVETDDAITSSPTFFNQKVYFGSYDQHIYCVDVIDGEIIWKKPTFGLISSSPVIYNQDLYIGSYDKNLYKVDAETGHTQWIFNIQGQMNTSPIIRGINETAVPAVSGDHPY